MTGTINDDAESIEGQIVSVEIVEESDREMKLEEGMLLPVAGSTGESCVEGLGMASTSTSTVKTTLIQTDDTLRGPSGLKLNECDVQSISKISDAKIDEDLAVLPPELRILDSIQRVVTPGAFAFRPSPPEDNMYNSMEIDSDCDNSLHRSDVNTFLGITTTLEATLVTNDDIPDPPVLVAAVSDKIMLAEIISVDNRTSNVRIKKDRSRIRLISLLVAISVFVATVICSVLVTIRLKADPDDDDDAVPALNDERPHWSKIVTHHVFVYGGRTTCNDFSVGSVRLYCAGTFEVNDDAIAFINVLNISSPGTSCKHIGSNAVKCDTIVSNGTFHAGVVFSCGRSNYVDEKKVAAAAFLDASSGSDCANGNESNAGDALVFSGLGHFCEYSQKESDMVTWKIEPNLVMENGAKLANQCETETAGFISVDDQSTFDYCYQADRSCNNDTNSADVKCAIGLDSLTVSDSFGKCGNLEPSSGEIIEALENLTSDLMKNDQIFFDSYHFNVSGT